MLGLTRRGVVHVLDEYVNSVDDAQQVEIERHLEIVYGDTETVIVEEASVDAILDILFHGRPEKHLDEIVEDA